MNNQLHYYIIKTSQGEVQIPFTPATHFSYNTKEGVKTEIEPPAFIRAAMALVADPTNKDLARSFQHCSYLECISRSKWGMTLIGHQGNIVLTSSLPKNCMVVTNEFLYVSSHYVAETGVKWDFDGDINFVAINPYSVAGTIRLNGFELSAKQGLPIKNPITRAIEPVSVLQSEALQALKAERWWDLTNSRLSAWLRADETLRAKEADAQSEGVRKASFMKTHTIVPVGIADGTAKNAELAWSRTMSRDDKCKALYRSPLAYTLIEQEGLGGIRKDHDISCKDQQITRLVQAAIENPLTLATPYAVGTTRTNSGGKLKPHQTTWVGRLDLEKLAEDQMNGHFEFVEKGSGGEPGNVKIKTGNHNVVKILAEAGILDVKVLRNDFHPELPPALQIVMRRGNKTIALTDIRKAQGVIEGLVYTFILPPVFNADTGKWVSGLQHMHDMCQPVWVQQEDSEEWTLVQGVDGDIRTAKDGPFIRKWCQSQSGHHKPADFWAQDYKLGKFRAFLANHVSRYGLVVPAESGLSIPEDNLKFAVNTAVVDYGIRGYDLERWWNIFQNLTLLCPASKGTDERVRKYALNSGSGDHPWYANPQSNPRRAGQMLSQLSRVSKKMVMRVAIVCPTPLDIDPTHWSEACQYQITKSGIKKQMLDESVFMSRVSHVPHEDFTQEVKYTTIKGQERVAWLGDPKRTKRIGKLIDCNGGKAMPCPTIGFSQAWTEEEGKVCPEVGTVIEVRGEELTITEITEDRAFVVSKDGRVGHIMTPYFFVDGKVRKDIDLIVPVKELVDKGLLSLYLENASQDIMYTDNGEMVVVWVTDIEMFRTSTPTENLPTKLRTKMVKGFDALLVRGGFLRMEKEVLTPNPLTNQVSPEASTYWDFKTPNMSMALELKEAVHKALALLGHQDLVPTRTDETYSEMVGQQAVMPPLPVA